MLGLLHVATNAIGFAGVVIGFEYYPKKNNMYG